MSPSSPPEPSSDLTLDEWIAIIVTLTAIGGIFYWAVGREHKHKILETLGFSPPSSQPDSTPESPHSPQPQPTLPELSISESTPSRETKVPSNSTLEKPRQIPANPALPAPQTTPSPTSTPWVEFSDVPDQFWAKAAITTLAKQNIIVGFPKGKFQPQRFASRGELAVMLHKVFQPKPKQSAIVFPDLPPKYWGTEAIEAVTQGKILIGYPDDKFRPNQPITRAETLVVLAKVLNLKPLSEPSKILQRYEDRDQIPDYAIASVAAAIKAGIVVGYPQGNLLNPNKPATRAELAAMLYKARIISKQRA